MYKRFLRKARGPCGRLNRDCSRFFTFWEHKIYGLTTHWFLRNGSINALLMGLEFGTCVMVLPTFPSVRLRRKTHPPRGDNVGRFYYPGTLCTFICFPPTSITICPFSSHWYSLSSVHVFYFARGIVSAWYLDALWATPLPLFAVSVARNSPVGYRRRLSGSAGLYPRNAIPPFP